MKKHILKVSMADTCLFVHQCNGKKLNVIYVDDSLIAESDESEINVFIDRLCHTFKITMGTLTNFLGMQIQQHQDGIFVCQCVYTEKVLNDSRYKKQIQ